MCDIEKIRTELQARLGAPGKWELLFHEGHLIQGLARRIETGREFPNPYAQKAGLIGKPASAYMRDGEKIPVLADTDVAQVFNRCGCPDELPQFYLAGEPSHFRLNPAEATAGILVAGGNGAGLNMVVDSIVKRWTGLASEFRNDPLVRPRLLGYIGGFDGLAKGNSVPLNIEITDSHASDPCIFLKTLRGPRFGDRHSPEAQRELSRLADAVVRDRLDALFVIGGNGTFSWATRLFETLDEQRHPLALVGGPKTMDWDLSFADATFGFRTAVDHAVECIRTAHWEAESQNRIAVVELFGAGSGFVALHAGFLSGVADVILIPELPHPEEAVFRHIQRRLEKRDHACVVLAEGALEEFRHGNRAVKARAFASFLERLRQRFPHRDFVDIRPRYLIRGTPPNSFDLDLAKYSGYLMADAALSGYTNCSVQWWQGNYVLVPLPTAVAHLGQVPLWMPYFWYMAQRYLLPEASGDGATGAS
jgi:6-phosphofructokinase 1